MKNKILLGVIVFLIVILTACSHTEKEGVACTVYGNDISVAEIKNAVKSSKSIYEKNVKQINNLDISAEEKTKLINELGKPKTYDEILNEKTEHIVLLHEAGKKGFDVDFESCKKEATEVFTNLNQTTVDDTPNYLTLLETKNYMAENNLSDAEYINFLTNEYYDNARINKLKNYFKENLYDSQSKLSYEKQYSNYVQQLISDAEIEYYD